MSRRKITMAVAAALAFAAGFLSTLRSAPAQDSLQLQARIHVTASQPLH